ncbi:hypothetical protein L873DRAFT_1923342 [Choiromyces venosus 120613-1]|uniref:HTH CENPB-type domain-containing protein n=1 Tax=Choiromyces venosus 120613-1 TaxID=1336337 RepID=A0A3N4JJL3_9PEZI|nr:hypothetical protein L873DRAFT_1923342 [Choiromyces venosus 120613-1]
MPPTRTPLRQLKEKDANERGLRHRGPQPKSLNQRKIRLTVTPKQRVERTYTQPQKIEVLNWLEFYQVPNDMRNTTIKMRAPTLDEASAFFKIPKSTIGRWRKPEVLQKIVQQVGGDGLRRDTPATFMCLWPEMELKLFEAFIARRAQGRPVRDGWFRRKAKELWKTTYPNLPAGLFVFSQGWFHRFLSRHHVVLQFVTNTAQSLPDSYKEDILSWLRFNRRNQILTPLISSPLQASPSPLSLHYICNDNQGGIPEHRICNVDETPLPWEFLAGRTYDIQGARTIWSKSTQSGSEKRQYQRALFVFDCYRAHLNSSVIETCPKHKITPSLIPAGTTPLTQPLDVALNKPFKGLIKEFTEEIREEKEALEDIERWSTSQHRIVTTEAVRRAWEEWNKAQSRRKIIIQSFRDIGISLPVDGSCDHELKIKGFSSGELVLGDWARSEGEMDYGLLERENVELPVTSDSTNTNLEFALFDES